MFVDTVEEVPDTCQLQRNSIIQTNNLNTIAASEATQQLSQRLLTQDRVYGCHVCTNANIRLRQPRLKAIYPNSHIIKYYWSPWLAAFDLQWPSLLLPLQCIITFVSPSAPIRSAQYKVDTIYSVVCWLASCEILRDKQADGHSVVVVVVVVVCVCMFEVCVCVGCVWGVWWGGGGGANAAGHDNNRLRPEPSGPTAINGWMLFLNVD